MKKMSWEDKLIGQPMPSNIINIDWHEVHGGRQQYSIDQHHNEWRREEYEDCYVFWIHLPSEYRENVDLVVYIDADKSFNFTGFSVEAFAVSRGRPDSLYPQTREKNQVGRFIKSLFGLK